MRNSKTRSLTSKPPLVVDAHAIAALHISPLQDSLVILLANYLSALSSFSMEFDMAQ